MKRRAAVLSALLLLALLALAGILTVDALEPQGIEPSPIPAAPNAATSTQDQPGPCILPREAGITLTVELSRCLASDGGHFIIYYTTQPLTSSHAIRDADALYIAEVLEYVWNLYVNDPDFGFRVPLNTNVEPLEVWIYDIESEEGIGGLGGWTNRGMNVMAMSSLFTHEPRTTLLHELFHRVQYTYTDDSHFWRFNQWAFEGQARLMEDRVFVDLDHSQDSRFRQATRDAGAQPEVTLWRRSYSAAGFWQYFAEHYGQVSGEPQRGIDAIRAFWDAIALQDRPQSLLAIDDALDSLGYPGVTYRDVFHDWLVAQVTNLRLEEFPDPKYNIFDDDAAGWRLGWLGGEGVAQPTPEDYLVRQQQFVDTMAARHYWLHVGQFCPAVNVRFEQNLPGGYHFPLQYDVLAMHDGRLGDHWTSTAPDWSLTFSRGGYDLYAVLVVSAIVSADEGHGMVNVGLGCFTPTLEIVEPTQAQPAIVDDSGQFLVHLKLADQQGEELAGVRASDFQVSVGNQSADLIVGAPVDGGYLLVVQNRMENAQPGDYDLKVTHSEVSVTEPDGVRLVAAQAAVPPHDDLLVVDRSSSMAQPTAKFQAVKNALGLYADATGLNARLGLASFAGNGLEPDEDASLDYALAVMNAQNLNDLKAAISVLAAGGDASIGDGLHTGWQTLSAGGESDRACYLVLISDSPESEARYWDQPGQPSVRQSLIDSGCTIHTVALGELADEALLQEIACLTGGTYHYVPDQNPAALDTTADWRVYDWRNHLASTLEYIQGQVSGRSRLFEFGADIAEGAIRNHIVTVEEGTEEALFFANFAGHTGYEYLRLWDPDGYFVRCDDEGVRCNYSLEHPIFRVVTPALKAGNWQLSIGRTEAVTPGSTPYVVGASGASGRRLHLLPGAVGTDTLQGAEIPIVVALTAEGPVPGAAVTATIEGPLGLRQVLPLLDDGLHGDGFAGDGVYGGRFTRSTLLDPDGQLAAGPAEGSYRVRVSTPGLDGQIGPRLAQASFAVRQDTDSDGDGLPDGWEDAKGLDKLVPIDAKGDLDLDGLDNLGEYEAGTDPYDSDTDGGGENDGSEVEGFGQDPLDPADDQIVAIPWSYAWPHVSAVVLQLETADEHQRLHLFRSTSPFTGHVPINTNITPAGFYTDTDGVTNDVTYYYRLMAQDGEGHQSAVTPPLRATPKQDPFPPTLLDMSINRGAERTAEREVTLKFWFFEPAPHQDVAEIMIANEPDFAGATWQPYQPTVSWRLADGLQDGKEAWVYVRYRDEDQNESPEMALDAILFGPYKQYLPVALRAAGE